jgi:hypothetical protein
MSIPHRKRRRRTRLPAAGFAPSSDAAPTTYEKRRAAAWGFASPPPGALVRRSREVTSRPPITLSPNAFDLQADRVVYRTDEIPRKEAGDDHSRPRCEVYERVHQNRQERGYEDESAAKGIAQFER